ncbi:MAG: hypothetical protein LBU36_00840 [Clostridiales bacterium]|jgi:hypothetical protein|nr:hypothetical protein [Clostridiales bacterium]
MRVLKTARNLTGQEKLGIMDGIFGRQFMQDELIARMNDLERQITPPGQRV